MSWGKKDKDEDTATPMPKQCPHGDGNVVAWHPTMKNGKIISYNGLCRCGIYSTTKSA